MKRGDVTAFGDFSKLLLSENIARGGAGEIWTLENHPNFVAKIYHKSVKKKDYEIKINEMLDNRPAFDLHKVGNSVFPECTWPVSLIRDNNQFSGYIMPKIDFNSGVTLERFLNKRSREVDNLHEFAGWRLNIAYNLSLNVGKIHKNGHLIVDLKPQNCFVQKDKFYVAILDSDGFSIKSNNGLVFSAKQFTPEYVAPEFISKKPEHATLEQDLFALAVIIFRLVNNGIHPFQAGMKRGQKTIHEMVEKKLYAYSLKGPGRLVPSRFSEHLYWPVELREAFDQAFLSKSRPGTTDWKKLLIKYTSSDHGIVGRCNSVEDHITFEGVCPKCIGNLNFQHKTERRQINSRPKLAQKQSAVSNQNIKKNNSHLFKINLIKKTLLSSSIFYFIVFSFYLFLTLDQINFKILSKIIFDHYILNISFFCILSVVFYIFNRGIPQRDCPSCGAYAGSLAFRSEHQTFIKWLHQTKLGKPDQRYTNNPQMYSLVTDWHCPYCASAILFTHELSPYPNKKTPIISKSFSPNRSNNILLSRNLPKSSNKLRNLITFFLITLIFGFSGIQRFWVGRWATGFFMLSTFGGFGLFWIYDLFCIGLGKFKDKGGNQFPK